MYSETSDKPRNMLCNSDVSPPGGALSFHDGRKNLAVLHGHAKNLINEIKKIKNKRSIDSRGRAMKILNVIYTL